MVYFIQSPTFRPTPSLVDVLPMGILLFAEFLKVKLKHHPSSLVEDTRQRDGRFRPATTHHPNLSLHTGAVIRETERGHGHRRVQQPQRDSPCSDAILLKAQDLTG